MKNPVPKSHPRYVSLTQREKIVEGMRAGYVAEAGLVAQGRGEAFDYLLGEATTPEGKTAECAAVAALLLAKEPVISVNGNIAALVPGEIVKLSKLLSAKIEINLFYWNEKRVHLIENILKDNGADEIFGIVEDRAGKVPDLDSERGNVSAEGILSSDAILVPLEDGDRTEALIAMKKQVIAIDLNPMSRTARKATITIVDNVTRALPNMIKFVEELKKKNLKELKDIIKDFDNKKNLKAVTTRIRALGTRAL